jgi:hypothetical protein
MTPTRVWRTALVAALLVAATRLWAEEPPRPAERRLVVMKDGRILEGVVTRQAAGYYVEKANGRILAPYDDVKCVARNLVDAYHQQREALLDPTAADLIRLADWCITYRLYDEARDELRRALRRDPEHETARRMLSRLEDTLMAKPPSVETPMIVANGLVVPEVEALGGLSRPTAARFTERIQPLLMNKCGGTSCHGSAAQNEFRLTPIRLESRNHRRTSEQNLAQVLKFVDIANPQHSPLLEKPRGAHGGATLAMFSGAQGAEQQKLLRSWVETVSQERRAEDEKLAQVPKLSKKPAVVTASLEVEDRDPKSSETSDLSNGDDIESRLPKSQKTSEVSNAQALDRFDPAEFNRKFGGRKRNPR